MIGISCRTRGFATETDAARVIFEGDYLREHITLGYATTLHAAQGITVGNSTTRGACFTVLSDQSLSRHCLRRHDPR
jgi:hypothetical protein